MNIATQPPATQDVRGRATWVDDARGIGIVLVVIGHAIGGLQSAKLVSPDSGYGLTFQLIYSFHMPLFFLLSGLFAERFSRGLPSGHLGKSIMRLAYPYFLWSLISVAVITSLGNLVNAPVHGDLNVFVGILWAPPSQLWFLYSLFLIQLIYIAFSRVVGLTTLFAFLLALRLVPAFVTLPEVIKMTFTYGVFFALGAVAAKQLLHLPAALTKPKLLQVALGAIIVWTAATLLVLETGGGYLDLAMIPASLAGTCAAICLAMVLPQSVEFIARYLGSISMPIYLAHVLFVAGSRIVLAKLIGLDNPALLLPVLVASGIIGPMVMWELSKRLRFTRLLGFT